MKTKHSFLLLACLICTLCIKAQEKYDYLMIEYNTRNYDLAISSTVFTYKKEKVDFSNQEKTGFNTTPFLNKIKEFEDKDWELVSFNTAISQTISETYFAYMRKKRSK